MAWINPTCLVLLFAVAASAQPVVNSALNSAGYQTPPKGDPPIAQGSIFVLFGTGLAGPDLAQASAFPLPSSLPANGGTSISVSSGGRTANAYMVYTLPSQVAAILPSTTPLGPANLTLTYNGQTSAPIDIQVTRSAPGIYTLNARGSGPAAAQVAFNSTDIRLNNLTTPAAPGSIITLYGTGLGPISGADNTPPGAVSPGGIVTATIGGRASTVLYAGRAPQFPGEDQINIQLPNDVPLGCYTQGVISVNGIPSNDFVISTGNVGSTSCKHPFSLTPQVEATLDAGGKINIGAFTAALGTIDSTTQEGLGGLFVNVDASGLFATYSAVVANLHAVAYPAPPGGCVLYDQLLGPPATDVLPASFSIVGARELQAAPALTLNGSVAAVLTRPSMSITQSIARSNAGGPGYLWTNTIVGPGTPIKLAQGNWSLVGDSAGPDVATFSASASLPQTLVWTNIAGLKTAFRSGVTMNWTGGCTITQGVACAQNPATPEYVNIFGNSSVFNPADPSQNRGKSFSCTEVASIGIFVIPKDITGALPVAGTDEVGTGFLGISDQLLTPFLAFLRDGGRLDGGVFAFANYMINSGSGFAWR